jgi:hypothetical protein
MLVMNFGCAPHSKQRGEVGFFAILFFHAAQNAPMACRGFRGLKVKLAFKGHKGHRVRRATKATWEQLVLPAPKALRDPLVPQAPAVAAKGEPSTGAIRVVQGDSPASCESNEALVSVFCPSGGATDGPKCPSSPTVGLCMRK